MGKFSNLPPINTSVSATQVTPNTANASGGRFSNMPPVTPQLPTQQTQEPEKDGILKQIGTGLLNIVRTPATVAKQIGVTIGEGVDRAIQGTPLDKSIQGVLRKTGITPEQAQNAQQIIQTKNILEDKDATPFKSAPEAIGRIGEAALDLSTPFVGAGRGALAGAKAISPTLAKSGLLQGAKQLVPRAAELAGTGIGFKGASNLQEGKPLTEGMASAGLLSAALPVAGAVLGKTVKGAGRLGAEILGKATGTSESVINEAFNNPAVVKFAIIAGVEGQDSLMTQALEETQKGFSLLKKNRANEYTKELEKIKLNKGQFDSIVKNVRGTAKELIKTNGIKISEAKGLLNRLNFENSTIERGQGSVQKAFNDVMKWTDNTPAGLDKLKKKLSQHLDEIPVTERGGAFNFILQLKESVNGALKKEVPGYEQMVSKYSEASDIIDDVQKALSLKDTASKETALKKVMLSLRQNNELRKDFLEMLGQLSGKDITGKIAGASLSTWTPRGLAGTLQPGIGLSGTISSLINPSTIPMFLAYLGASSPRLVAEAVALLGKTKGKTIPPEIRRSLSTLIIRAMTNEVPGQGQSPMEPQTVQEGTVQKTEQGTP